MNFPSYETWVQTVLHPRDRVGGGGPYCFETEGWYRAYQAKARIAAALRPQSVLEIGIRYGYSAHAFLQCPSVVTYIGVDIDDTVLNAMGEPTCEWAMAMLGRTTLSTIQREFIKANTRTTSVLDLGLNGIDFVYIDADHTYEGAIDDMLQAWQLTQQVMLVDDYIGSPPVRDAVEAFVAKTNALLMTAPSGTGEALLLK